MPAGDRFKPSIFWCKVKHFLPKLLLMQYYIKIEIPKIHIFANFSPWQEESGFKPLDLLCISWVLYRLCSCCRLVLHKSLNYQNTTFPHFSPNDRCWLDRNPWFFEHKLWALFPKVLSLAIITQNWKLTRIKIFCSFLLLSAGAKFKPSIFWSHVKCFFTPATADDYYYIEKKIPKNHIFAKFSQCCFSSNP
jgi:hypothetical protein